MSKDNIINLASQMIEIPSVQDNPQAQKEVIDLCLSDLKKQQNKIYIHQHEKNGVHSIVATLQDTKEPDILLMGHLDVVSAAKEEYVPQIKNGKLYGRGSGDMKGPVAVMFEIFKYFAAQKKKPSLGIMLTSDEEIGGENGTGYLINNQKYRAKVAINPDSGTGLDTLITEQKGALLLEIQAEGKSAHGSRPFLGENAIDKLLHVYHKLRHLIPENLTPEWGNTMTLSKFTGGEQAINKVPAQAQMALDIRLTRPDDRQKILDNLEEIKGIKYNIFADVDPFVQPEDHRGLQKFAYISEQALGRKVVFNQESGGCDARYLSKYGIPVIVNGIHKKNVHATNEWADIEELHQFYDILLQFIGEF